MNPETRGGQPLTTAQIEQRLAVENTFNTDLGHPITLNPKSRFEGGEKALFETSDSRYLAGIQFIREPEHVRRVQAIVENPLSKKVPQNMDGQPLLALPVSRLLSQKTGNYVGELIPYIKSPNKIGSFMFLGDREERQAPENGLQYLTTEQLLLYMKQYAQALDFYHTVYAGVGGDINRGGIITTRPRIEKMANNPSRLHPRIHPGGITLIDFSTSQFMDKDDNIIPSSGVGKDYIAPELFFSNYDPRYKKQIYTTMLEMHDPNKKPRQPTEDLHILAVMALEVLNAEILSNTNPQVMRVPKLVPIWETDYYLRPTRPTGEYGISNDGLQFLPSTTLPAGMYGQKLNECLYLGIIEGFNNPYARPTAAQWIEAIDETLELLRPCPNKVPNHLIVEGTDLPYDCVHCYTESQGEAGRYFTKVQ